MKKLSSIIMSLMLSVMVASVNVSAFNLSPLTNMAPNKHIEVITNQNALEALVEKENIEVPKGYKLEKVIITRNIHFESFANVKREPSSKISEIKPMWFDNWEIRNFKKDSYRITYPNYPLRVSNYEGPSTAQMTVSDSLSNQFTAYSGISVSMVEAKVGYSRTETRTISDSISVPVKAGTTLRIKAYALYDQWRMDVYKNGKFVAEEFFHRPVGIEFQQYVFSTN